MFGRFSLSFLFPFIVALATSVNGVESVDVLDPVILSPHTGTTWVSGQVQNITWSTAGFFPPTCGDDVNSAIFLANFSTVNTTLGAVASNFSITLGQTQIIVPNVTDGVAYRLLLISDTSDFSDTGSFSAYFTINSKNATNVTETA